MPRGLTGRIALALSALALVAILAVGATLFVVVSRAYADDEQSTLTTVSIALASRPNVLAQGRVPLETIFGTRSELLAQDVSIYVVRSGQLVLVSGDDAHIALPDLPQPATARTVKGSVRGDRAYLYGATVFGTAARRADNLDAVVVVAPDSAPSNALRTVGAATLALIVVLVVIGGAAAWLLSRSISRPIRRLVHATARVAAAEPGDPPIPEEGPEEIRELTRHFNEMSAELAQTRDQEAQLLASLRHDLRTPLTGITGFAEAISDGTVTGDSAAAAARTIVEEAHRLERLVAELGVIDRLRQGPAALKPETLEARALIASTIERFGPQAGGAGVELVETPSPEIVFTGDRLAVERILQNLVENALHAVSRDGHIWLEALASEPPGRRPGVVLRVTDDGPGFPPGAIPHVFERFFRADPSRAGQGSGLGLAIVRELAQAHGGEAWAENVAPRGARVSVYLPRQ